MPQAVQSSVSPYDAGSLSGSSSSWSAEDGEKLVEARRQGLNWNEIAPKYFPTRSPNACRKRHERLMERMNAEHWEGIKLDVLAQAYMEVRTEMWSVLAARVGEKWQLVETKCMALGLKNISQAARSALKRQGGYHCGTYVDHADSGIGTEDYEDEIEHLPPIPPTETPMRDDRSEDLVSVVSPMSSPVKQPPTVDNAPGYDSTIVQTSPVEKSESPPLILATNILQTSKQYATPCIEKNLDVEGWSSPEEKSHGSLAPTPSDAGTETTDTSETSLQLSDVGRMQNVDIGKAEIIDRLMICFYDLFADPITYTRQCSGSSPSSSSGSSRSTSSDGLRQSPANSKRKIDDGNSGDGHEDDQSDRKRQRGKGGLKQQATTEKRFACPYFKRDPQRARSSRACRGPGWTSVHRIKEHLYREHALSLYCRRCYTVFENEAQLTEHSRLTQICIMRDAQPPEGFDKDQERRLKSRGTMFRADSEEQKWKHVYLILFPNTGAFEMPSPYYETEAANQAVMASSPSSSIVKQREAFINRELPRKVRKALEKALEKNFGPFEETLKSELENIVRDCHETLIRSFVEVSRVPLSPRGIPVSAEVALAPEREKESPEGPVFGLSPYLLPQECILESWQGVLDTLSGTSHAQPSDSTYQSYWGNSPIASWGGPSFTASLDGEDIEAHLNKQNPCQPDFQL